MSLLPKKSAASVSSVAPVISGAAYDQPSYLIGQTMTLTVFYTQGASGQTTNTTVTGTDTITGQPATITVALTVQEPDGPLAWKIVDAANRAYTQVPGSDTGSQVKFTAVA